MSWTFRFLEIEGLFSSGFVVGLYLCKYTALRVRMLGWAFAYCMWAMAVINALWGVHDSPYHSSCWSPWSVYTGYILRSACAVWQCCSCSYSSCVSSLGCCDFLSIQRPGYILMTCGTWQTMRTMSYKGYYIRKSSELYEFQGHIYLFGEIWTFVSSHELLSLEMLGTLTHGGTHGLYHTRWHRTTFIFKEI